MTADNHNQGLCAKKLDDGEKKNNSSLLTDYEMTGLFFLLCGQETGLWLGFVVPSIQSPSEG